MRPSTFVERQLGRNIVRVIAMSVILARGSLSRGHDMPQPPHSQTAGSQTAVRRIKRVPTYRPGEYAILDVSDPQDTNPSYRPQGSSTDQPQPNFRIWGNSVDSLSLLSSSSWVDRSLSKLEKKLTSSAPLTPKLHGFNLGELTTIARQVTGLRKGLNKASKKNDVGEYVAEWSSTRPAMRQKELGQLESNTADLEQRFHALFSKYVEHLETITQTDETYLTDDVHLGELAPELLDKWHLNY